MKLQEFTSHGDLLIVGQAIKGDFKERLRGLDRTSNGAASTLTNTDRLERLIDREVEVRHRVPLAIRELFPDRLGNLARDEVFARGRKGARWCTRLRLAWKLDIVASVNAEP